MVLALPDGDKGIAAGRRVEIDSKGSSRASHMHFMAAKRDKSDQR